VTEFGSDDWFLVAFLHGTRNPRQCRDRYQNYLCPALRSDPWTPEEDSLLMQKCAEYGTKWNKIAEFFHDRSDNALRNRWQLLDRREARQWRDAGIARPPPPMNKKHIPRPIAPSVPPRALTIRYSQDRRDARMVAQRQAGGCMRAPARVNSDWNGVPEGMTEAFREIATF
jgi:hypothetical protein